MSYTICLVIFHIAYEPLNLYFFLWLLKVENDKCKYKKLVTNDVIIYEVLMSQKQPLDQFAYTHSRNRPFACRPNETLLFILKSCKLFPDFSNINPTSNISLLWLNDAGINYFINLKKIPALTINKHNGSATKSRYTLNKLELIWWW